jgi:DNA-binding Xre family transcriptional regulator
MTESAHWSTSDYLRIVTAHYDPESGSVAVAFGDGDNAVVATTRLVQRGPRELDWRRLTVEDSSYLHIPALPDANRDAADIPSFDIRALSDAEFAAHLDYAAREAARRVGERVRVLREARGLSVEDAATRTGITEHTLAHIERGQQRDVDFPTLERILTAMGYSLKDILPEQTAALVK